MFQWGTVIFVHCVGYMYRQFYGRIPVLNKYIINSVFSDELKMESSLKNESKVVRDSQTIKTDSKFETDLKISPVSPASVDERTPASLQGSPETNAQKTHLAETPADLLDSSDLDIEVSELKTRTWAGRTVMIREMWMGRHDERARRSRTNSWLRWRTSSSRLATCPCASASTSHCSSTWPKRRWKSGSRTVAPNGRSRTPDRTSTRPAQPHPHLPSERRSCPTPQPLRACCTDITPPTCFRPRNPLNSRPCRPCLVCRPRSRSRRCECSSPTRPPRSEPRRNWTSFVFSCMKVLVWRWEGPDHSVICVV